MKDFCTPVRPVVLSLIIEHKWRSSFEIWESLIWPLFSRIVESAISNLTVLAVISHNLSAHRKIRQSSSYFIYLLNHMVKSNDDIKVV